MKRHFDRPEETCQFTEQDWISLLSGEAKACGCDRLFVSIPSRTPVS